METNLRSSASSDPVAYISELLQLVRAAERHVIIVNWPGEEPSDADLVQARRSYLGELLAPGKRFRYERILQAPAGSLFTDGYDRAYVDHFSQMVGTPDCELMVADPLVPITFAIVDDRHLAVEVNVRDSTQPGDDAWKPDRSFILRDAPPQVLACFQDLASRLRKDATTVSDGLHLSRP